MKGQGYEHFYVVDEPTIIDDFIYQSPVVAIASKYPIIECIAVEVDQSILNDIALTDSFEYSRKVLRATIDVPHLGLCDCYVVHFKSKRPSIEFDSQDKKLTDEELLLAQFKAQISGSWASSVQRGSEATLLFMEMLNRRAETNQPMVLLGDFNNSLDDSILNHLLTDTLRFTAIQQPEKYLSKYRLKDAWDLFDSVQRNEKTELTGETLVTRAPSHYFGANSSVLDYILLSCEFDPSYDDSLFHVSDYHTYDRHLINPKFDRDDQSTDHGVISITLSLRM